MNLSVSSSPHIRSALSTPRIMLCVVLALTPAALFGVYHFGVSAAVALLSSIIGAVGAEALIQVLFKRPVTILDGSALVTGLLVGMCCPPYVPFWLPALGSVFAIGMAKLPFGGLGHNFINPALAGRAFLLASWPALMSTYSLDAVSQATPLAQMPFGMDAVSQATSLAQPPSYADLFFGNIAGCIGEVSKLALLIGGIYLLVRGIISWQIPLAYMGTVCGLTYLLGGDGLYAVLSGGVVMAAFFMCTDYVTSPVTGAGQLIMGIGAGAITVVIRLYGSYPEGVTYAVLLMNCLTPLIDRFLRPRVYGEGRRHA